MNEIYNEIRSLLDRWYAAQCTPQEEQRLGELFRSATELPEDLAADKKLFLSLSGPIEVEIEEDIPFEYAERISAAIEAEIAGTSSGDTNGISRLTPRRAIWFRRSAAIVGIAAALLGALLLVRPLINAPIPADPTQLAAVGDAQIPQPAGSGEKIEKEAPLNFQVTVPACPPPVKRLAATRKSGPAKKPPVKDASEDDCDDFGYLSEEEEARLIAGHYRVISDEREAYAMVNTVFSRLEGHIIQEDFRLDGISAQYETEINSLYN